MMFWKYEREVYTEYDCQELFFSWKNDEDEVWVGYAYGPHHWMTMSVSQEALDSFGVDDEQKVSFLEFFQTNAKTIYKVVLLPESRAFIESINPYDPEIRSHISDYAEGEDE